MAVECPKCRLVIDGPLGHVVGGPACAHKQIENQGREIEVLKTFANTVIQRVNETLTLWDCDFAGCKDKFPIDLYLTAGELRAVQSDALAAYQGGG